MTKTYAQLLREIASLQATAQRQLAIESKSAVSKINELIAKFNLTAGDLQFASVVGAPASRSKGTNSVKPKEAAGKSSSYGDGQGNVWGGRGPRPRWLRSALESGRTLESFLIGARQNASLAGASPKPSMRGVAPAKRASGQRVASKRVAVAIKRAKQVDVATTPTAKKTQTKLPAQKAIAQKTVKPAASASEVQAASKKAPRKTAVATRRSSSAKPRKVAAKKVAPPKKTVSASKALPAPVASASAKPASAPMPEAPAFNSV
jgi:DNA-binding protein H-NS